MGNAVAQQALQVVGETRQLRTEFRKPIGGNGNNSAANSEILLLDTAPGGVNRITTTNRGSLYSSAPTISFSGGGGTGAAATCQMAGTAGGVSLITVTNGGTGYTGAPSVVITPTSGGSGATATAIVNNGVVVAVKVTAAGTGYAGNPTISFSGGGGTGAAATAIAGLFVDDIYITAAGSGYTSPPTISFSSGTAAATCTLGSSSAGNLEMLTMAISATWDEGIYYDGTLNIYVDGEGTASLQLPLGDLFCYRQSANTVHTSPSFTFANKKVSVTVNNSSGMGGHRVLYVPFTSRLKVTYKNNSGTNGALVYTQVEYRLGPPPACRTNNGRRNKLRAFFSNGTTTPATTPQGYQYTPHFSPVTLVNVSGYAGEMESITHHVLNLNGTTPTHLEGHVKYTTDGALMMEYGGTEDAFGNFFYGAVKATSEKWGMPASDVWNGTGYVSTGYRMFDNPDDKLVFGNSVNITATNGIETVDPGSVNVITMALVYTSA